MTSSIANSSPAPITQCVTEEIHEERFLAHVDSDLQDLIPEYLEERQNDIHRMQEAMNVQDYETISIAGHTLKGSGGGFGFGPISDIRLQLEGAAEEKTARI